MNLLPPRGQHSPMAAITSYYVGASTASLLSPSAFICSCILSIRAPKPSGLGKPLWKLLLLWRFSSGELYEQPAEGPRKFSTSKLDRVRVAPQVTPVQLLSLRACPASGRTLTPCAQRGCGCPIPATAPGWTAWGSEQPDAVKGVPALLEWDDL